jgi:hypothetical protein
MIRREFVVTKCRDCGVLVGFVPREKYGLCVHDPRVSHRLSVQTWVRVSDVLDPVRRALPCTSLVGLSAGTTCLKAHFTSDFCPNCVTFATLAKELQGL